MKDLVSKLTNRWQIVFAGGIVLGVIVVLGIRFATYSLPKDAHYHANFALYVNGQRQEFKEPQYYTDVEMCTLSKVITPASRAHMHDKVNDVIHVEDDAVTWGDFFSNLGWSFGKTGLISPDGVAYTENDTAKLHLILNGDDYTGFGGLQNTVINDKDRLLVSFGESNTATTKQQYDTIRGTAARYDTAKDPASCSGNHAETPTVSERLKHLF